MILLIDNYDSFVYNLARYLSELGCDVEVVRNDSIGVEDVRQMPPQAVLISPGPCTPNEAGISVELIGALAATTPMLGVCLGHQAIAAAFGGEVVRSPVPIHGMSWPIRQDGSRLFAGLPNPLHAGRYHSLCVPEATLPAELRVTARTEEGVVMAFEHVRYSVFGVQFHPESVLTEQGHRLLANFLAIAGIDCGAMPGGDFTPADVPLERVSGPQRIPLTW